MNGASFFIGVIDVMRMACLKRCFPKACHDTAADKRVRHTNAQLAAKYPRP